MGKVDSIQIPVFETAPPDYEVDFYAWLMEQSARLRLLRVPGIDSDNLAEEMLSLARRDRNAVASRVIVIIAHLLKWKYQPSHRTPSWQLTLLEQRRQVAVLLTDSPSLRRVFESVVETEYRAAVKRAALETGLPEICFPITSEWTPDQVLSSDFLPEQVP